jgi:phosphate transport system substrate-binding protein
MSELAFNEIDPASDTGLKSKAIAPNRRSRYTAALVCLSLTASSAIAQNSVARAELDPPAAKPVAPAPAKPAATGPSTPAAPEMTDFDRLCATLDFSGYPEHITNPSATGTVRLTGSTTVANLMHRTGDALEALTAGRIKLNIEGGASTAAVPTLMEGRCDIGTLSRSVNEKERAAFTAKFGYPLTEVPIAIDAVAIFVNKRNPIAGLTLQQLEMILAQTPRGGGLQAKLWSDIGAPNLPPEISALPLTVYGQNVRSEPVPSSVTQGVASERGGIGYASIFFDNVRTRPVPLSTDGKNFIEPSYQNVVDGTYPLARGFYLVLNVPPGQAPAPHVRELLGFLLSREGQQLMAAEGNYPLTKKQVLDSRSKVLVINGEAEQKDAQSKR